MLVEAVQGSGTAGTAPCTGCSRGAIRAHHALLHPPHCKTHKTCWWRLRWQLQPRSSPFPHHKHPPSQTPTPPHRHRLPAGELTGENIEVGIVGEDRKFRVLTPAEVTDYLQEVE